MRHNPAAETKAEPEGPIRRAAAGTRACPLRDAPRVGASADPGGPQVVGRGATNANSVGTRFGRTRGW